MSAFSAALTRTLHINGTATLMFLGRVVPSCAVGFVEVHHER